MSAVAITINRLLAAPAVTAVVSNRIYPVAPPQGTQPPAIAVHLISTMDQPHLNGPGNYFRSVVQVDSLATTAGPAIDLGEKAIAALNGITKQAFGSFDDVDILLDSGSDISEYDETAAIFRRLTRFVVRWRKA